MLNLRKTAFLLAFAMLLGVTPSLFAQDPPPTPPKKEKKKKKKKKGDEAVMEEKPAPPPEKKKDKKKTEYIKDKVAKSIPYDGLFPIYQDSTTGKLMMVIKEDQLEKDFIHFSYVENGVLDAGNFKGAYGGGRIFRISKYFERLEFNWENTSFYFDENNELSKSSSTNINEPVVYSAKVVARDSAETEYLIEVDKLFMSETFSQIKRVFPPGMGPRNPFRLGKLSSSKSRYESINGYPENTNLLVKYVYDNPYPTNGGSAAVTDARYVSVYLQHSLIEVPDNDFQPRYDDPRVGYFTTQVTDKTSTSATPYRDLVHRWNLVKKDPNAAISEPVEPIVYWMENTTPKEIRQWIKEGVESWNIAFEAAGFRNAIVVKQQPDDADWDAGDLRYNVLRWTSSPQPPFAGYGPSFVNPRTGQILGADIMLEFVFLSNNMRYDRLTGSANETLESLMFPEEHSTHLEDQHGCELSTYMQEGLQFAKVAGRVLGLDEAEESRLIEEAVKELVLHEGGHTLGLNHNFKSSQLWDNDEVHNAALTSKTGLTGSVMDYAMPNLNMDGSQGQYYTTVPGPYDVWAIEFAYSEALSDEKKEAERLEKILSRSSEPNLAFGNDADDMRAPGKGIDPRVMIWDMFSDAVEYSADRVEMVKGLMNELEDKLKVDGSSYQELRNGYNLLLGQWYRAMEVTTRYIGGVQVERTMIGQKGEKVPFTPVPASYQKKAMESLAKYAFAPDAFMGPDDLYQYLQIQRRGFNLFTGTEDPKLHDIVLSSQRRLLAHIVHPNVTKRMIDSELYGNEYSLNEMMGDLTSAIFNSDLNGKVSTTRQNLQLLYVDGLTSAFNSPRYDQLSKSVILNEIMRIDKMMSRNPGKDSSTIAHRKHLAFNIEKALDED